MKVTFNYRAYYDPASTLISMAFDMKPLPHESLIKASFERLSKEGGKFYTCFYDDFLQSDPEIVNLFKNTDFKQQKMMLAKSLRACILMEEKNLDLNNDPYILNIVEHHQQLNIPVRLFSKWQSSLLKTINTFDKSISEKELIAWQNITSKIIAVFIE